MNLQQKQTFIFDMDGTLVDLEELNIHGYAKTLLNHFNKELSLDDYQKYFSGTKTAAAFLGYTSSQNIEDVNIDELIKQFRDIKRKQLEKDTGSVAKIKPYAKDYLEHLRKNAKTLILATSTIKEFTDIILKYFDISDHFDIILTAEDVTKSKPDPEVYEKAMEMSKSSRKDSVVFEDSKNGIRSAKNAGIYCIGIHTKGLNDEYVSEADRVVDSYKELLVPT